MFLGAIYKCSFNHKLWCTLGLIRFNLFINDLPLHAKNISVDCDMLTDDTTLRTFGFFLFGFFYRKKYARQFRSGIQLVWHNHNHMVINPIKTKSVTIATRQKHQLSPLPFDHVPHGAKIDQVSEHSLLDITIDNKLRIPIMSAKESGDESSSVKITL